MNGRGVFELENERAPLEIFRFYLNAEIQSRVNLSRIRIPLKTLVCRKCGQIDVKPQVAGVFTAGGN